MVKIKRKGSVKFITKEYSGPIDKLPFKDYFEDLKKRAKKKRAKPYGKPVAFYYHDFSKSLESHFRVDIGKPVRELVKADKGYKFKFLPTMKRAVKKFHGTLDDYEEAYKEMYEYIEEEGLEQYGERMEKFIKIPKEVDGDLKIKSELQIPVEKPAKS